MSSDPSSYKSCTTSPLKHRKRKDAKSPEPMSEDIQKKAQCEDLATKATPMSFSFDLSLLATSVVHNEKPKFKDPISKCLQKKADFEEKTTSMSYSFDLSLFTNSVLPKPKNEKAKPKYIRKKAKSEDFDEKTKSMRYFFDLSVFANNVLQNEKPKTQHSRKKAKSENIEEKTKAMTYSFDLSVFAKSELQDEKVKSKNAKIKPKKKAGSLEKQRKMSRLVEFQLLEPTENRIIYVGLFPPAKAVPDKQHDNRTSRDIIAVLGHNHFDWMDLYLYSPEKKSSDLDQVALRQYLRLNQHYAYSQFKRVTNRVAQLHSKQYIPILFICGVICSENWNIYCPRREVIDSFLNIWSVAISNVKCIVVYGDHPSYHLMTHGSEEAVKSFRNHAQILKHLLLYPNKLDNIRDVIDQAEANRLEKAEQWYFKVFKTKVLSEKHTHLQKMPFNDDGFVYLLDQLIQGGFLSLLTNRVFCDLLSTERFVLQFWKWVKEPFVKTQAGLKLMYNEKFLERLQEDGFLAQVKKDRIVFGRFFDGLYRNRLFVLKTGNQDFEFFVQHLKTHFSEEVVYGLLLTDDFIKLGESFWKYYQEWKYYANNSIQLFSSGSFCRFLSNKSDLLKRAFHELLKRQTCREEVVKLMAVCTFLVCFERHESLLLERYDHLRSIYTTKDVNRTIFQCSAFVHRVIIPSFWAFFTQFISDYGIETATQIFGYESFCECAHSRTAATKTQYDNCEKLAKAFRNIESVELMKIASDFNKPQFCWDFLTT